MQALGKNTGTGLLPFTPSLEDLMKRGGILNDGFEGLKNTMAGKHLSDAAEKPGDNLKMSYYRLFNGKGTAHDAEQVLDDLLNQTLRRPKVVPQAGVSFEGLMPYFVERHGQDGAITYILKMIQDGADLPEKENKKSKSKR